MILIGSKDRVILGMRKGGVGSSQNISLWVALNLENEFLFNNASLS